jgi:hypothetical protein
MKKHFLLPLKGRTEKPAKRHLLLLIGLLALPLSGVWANSMTETNIERPQKGSTQPYSKAQHGSVAEYVKSQKQQRLRQQAEDQSAAQRPKSAGFASASAAPAITESDILTAYALGSTFRFRYYDGTSDPLSMDLGTVDLASPQAWTAPTFTPDAEEEWNVLDPADTPYASEFPTATHAAFLNGTCGEDVIDYYTIGNGLLELTGNVETESGDLYVDSLFFGMAAFPLGINFNYTENQVFEEGSDRFRIQSTAVSQGYGMLQTAYGTFEVLKVYQSLSLYVVEPDDSEVFLLELGAFSFAGKNGYQLYLELAENSPTTGETDIVYVEERAPFGAADPSQPSIACPPSMVANVPNGQCSATMNFAEPTFSDNDPDPLLEQTCGEPSGSDFEVGDHVVEWTVTDIDGLTALCQTRIRVKDAQVPSISCPGNLVRHTDVNQCGTSVLFANPTFSDNCAGAALTQTGGPASGSFFPKGMNLVSWKVADASGNTAVCQMSVTVNDVQLPKITCPASIVRNTDPNQCSAVATYATPTFSDNCTGASAERTSGLSSGSAFGKGTNTVIWRAMDGAGLSVTCSFTVTVNDGQQPSISCPPNMTRSTDPDACTAVTSYPAPAYSDNCTGGGASLQSGLPSGQPFPKGMTVVVWRATDAAGLTRTCSFRVTVNDTQAPTAACPPNAVVSTDANQCSATVAYANATFTDNCPGGTVTRISGLPSGSAFPTGVSAVVFRAVDGAGMSRTCSFSVIVTDHQAPTIVCPDDISVTAPPGQCSATVIYANPTAADNCGVQSVFLVSGLGSGSLFPQGPTVSTWRAVDHSGRSSACSFRVTVACATNSSAFELQTPNFKLQTPNSELQTPNSELQTSNSELQTSNSELQTSNSELQTSNSELQTSNSELQTPNFKLFPNPATVEVQVWVEKMEESGAQLTLLDAQGKAVWHTASFSGPAAAIPLSGLPAGLYQVRLCSERGVTAKALAVGR